MTRMTRRSLPLLGAGLFAAPALAQGFPDRQITMISPWALTGPAFTVNRALADGMAELLGQQVVLLQRDGASGTVGMRALATSAPDGLTIGYTPMTPVVVQPHLIRNLGIGPDSFATVCNVTENILGIVVRADGPFRDVPSLVAAARQRPVTFGTAGQNSLPYLGVHRIQAAAGGEWTHVPFRGDGPPIVEVLAGRLDFASILVSSAAQMIRSGQVRLVGVFSDRRHPAFPDSPTMREQGLDVVQRSYAGMYAPRGTPEAVLDRLEAACRHAMGTRGFLNAVEIVGAVPDFRGRAEQARMVAAEYAAFAQVLRELGVEPQ